MCWSASQALIVEQLQLCADNWALWMANILMNQRDMGKLVIIACNCFSQCMDTNLFICIHADVIRLQQQKSLSLISGVLMSVTMLQMESFT